GVGQEALHQVRLGRVGVLRAGDLVRHEHDRVGPGRRGVAGQVEGEAAGAATLDALGLGEDVRRRLRGRAGVGVADLDQRLAQAAGLALVGVADRAVAALDRADHAGRAQGRLAGPDGPRAGGLLGPDVAGRLVQVVREVLR